MMKSKLLKRQRPFKERLGGRNPTCFFISKCCVGKQFKRLIKTFYMGGKITPKIPFFLLTSPKSYGIVVVDGGYYGKKEDKTDKSIIRDG